MRSPYRQLAGVVLALDLVGAAERSRLPLPLAQRVQFRLPAHARSFQRRAIAHTIALRWSARFCILRHPAFAVMLPPISLSVGWAEPAKPTLESGPQRWACFAQPILRIPVTETPADEHRIVDLEHPERPQNQRRARGDGAALHGET